MRTSVVLLFLVLINVHLVKSRRRVKYDDAHRIKKSPSSSRKKSPEEELRILKKIYTLFNEDVHHRSKKESFFGEGYHDHEQQHNEYTVHPLDHRGHYEPVPIYEPYHNIDEHEDHHEHHEHHEEPVHYTKDIDEHFHDDPYDYDDYSDNHEHTTHHNEKYKKKDSGQYYQFGFQVNNKKNVSHGHMEFEKGGKKVGQYKILLPDGRLQVVSYEADAYGFRPVVRFIKPKKKHEEHVHSIFKNTFSTTTQRPILPPIIPQTTTVTTTTTTRSSTTTFRPQILPTKPIYKKEEKKSNIIVIQLPDSYHNDQSHLKSTVYNIVDQLSKTTPRKIDNPPTFGHNDYLNPVKKKKKPQVHKRPSIRFSDVPHYQSYELTAENRHPVGLYYSDPHYISEEDYYYSSPEEDYYIISVDKEVSDQSPIYVLAKQKDYTDYDQF